ncbi:hypothetical protein [Roseivivax isoporae]|uniref:Uncharacterized protein n=1 Tax=Roseivivax isoporae LMG 25204 TaxID=1449351 RepID=X7FE26_9RHOB|nr:hypothetical protein [Roseivivax isoporae]ETX31025.1 hypothetical protein RISW2_01065 [Roseivivax isoporae LMG 25204]
MSAQPFEDFDHPFRVMAPGHGPAPLPRPVGPGLALDTANRDVVAEARDLGLLYGLAVLRDVPFRWMHDSHSELRFEGAARITLNGVERELAALLPEAAVRPCCRAMLGALTGGPSHRRSVLWSALRGGAPAVAPGDAALRPEAGAPVSAWMRWIERHHGARALPEGRQAGVPRSLAELAARVAEDAPAQALLGAALHFLDRGVALRTGTARGLLALLCEISDRAARRCDRYQPRRARPGEIAARLTLLHAGEPADAVPDGVLMGAVLRRMTARAPRLLVRIGAMNASAPLSAAMPGPDGEPCTGWSPVAIRDTLTLPPLVVMGRPLHPSAAQSHALTAAALASALKEVMDLGELEVELDRLVHDIALGQAVLGGTWPDELRDALRRGAALGRAVVATEAVPEDGTPCADRAHPATLRPI